MNKSLKIIQDNFQLTDDELREITKDRPRDSLFAIYMTSLDHAYNCSYVFELHDFNMHTKTKSIRGYTTLYQLLLKSDYNMRHDKPLFHFIANTICLTRQLKPGELL